MAQPNPLPPSATRKGPAAGEGSSTTTATAGSTGRGGGGGGVGGRGGAGRGRSGSGAGSGGGGTGGAGSGVGAVGFGLGTGPAARLGAAASGGGSWAEGSARRREARREEAASEEWIASTRKEVAKLCDVAAKPFWQKHSWFLDQLKLLQVPHGAGMEAMRIEVRRELGEDGRRGSESEREMRHYSCWETGTPSTAEGWRGKEEAQSERERDKRQAH